MFIYIYWRVGFTPALPAGMSLHQTEGVIEGAPEDEVPHTHTISHTLSHTLSLSLSHTVTHSHTLPAKMSLDQAKGIVEGAPEEEVCIYVYV
jgi:hypothetical protein